MSTTLTRAQVRRVDQLAVERYGMTGLVLMENAGRNAAAIIRRVLGEVGRAAIICGPGNNGGDGCVIARHLHNSGWSVWLTVTADEDRMTPDTLANFKIVRAMQLDPTIASDAASQQAFVRAVSGDEIVVDALLGTGFRGEVRSPTSELIDMINTKRTRGVVAVDVPSGLDCDSGQPSNATIRADLTVTFVAGKRGFSSESAEPYVGRVEIADIGAPRELIAEVATSSG